MAMAMRGTENDAQSEGESRLPVEQQRDCLDTREVDCPSGKDRTPLLSESSLGTPL